MRAGPEQGSVWGLLIVAVLEGHGLTEPQREVAQGRLWSSYPTSLSACLVLGPSLV